MSLLSKIRFPLLLSLFLLGGWGFYSLKSHHLGEKADQAVAVAIATPTRVTALGVIKPQGEIVAIAASAMAQGSRLEQLLVNKGDQVKKGQMIAIMDNNERLKAVLASAESEVELAIAKLQQIQAGAKQGEINAQQSEINRLEADQEARIISQEAKVNELIATVENAKTEFERYEYLYQQGAISASIKDSKELILITSQRNLQQAKAELNRLKNTRSPQLNAAKATLDRIAEVRPVDLNIAKAEINRAQANVNKAQADLAQSYVISTQEGTVLDILTYPGETVSNRGIIEIGNTQEMYVTAEVYESDIKRVARGQKAKITSEALPHSLEGIVERISSKVEQQNIVDTDPTSSIDRRIIEVEIHLDQDSSMIAKNFTNLQVTAQINQ
jgi:HlyD family secretion protein